jgi:hypothetical protein
LANKPENQVPPTISGIRFIAFLDVPRGSVPGSGHFSIYIDGFFL